MTMRYTCSYIGGPGAGCTARDLTGSPKEAPMARKSTPALTRLLSRIEIDPETECWVWQGNTTRKGYAVFRADDKNQRVHRYAYEQFVGPIPDGMTIDHLCCNTACCNPAHLDPCTSDENIRRANDRRTTCLSGKHAWTAENLSTTAGRKRCLPCSREWWHLNEARRLAEGVTDGS